MVIPARPSRSATASDATRILPGSRRVGYDPELMLVPPTAFRAVCPLSPRLSTQLTTVLAVRTSRPHACSSDVPEGATLPLVHSAHRRFDWFFTRAGRADAGDVGVA